MNDPPPIGGAPEMSRKSYETVRRGLAKRRAAERRFRCYGLSAILLGLTSLALLFASIVSNGYTAFRQTFVGLDIYFDAELIDPQGNRSPESLATGDYGGLVKRALSKVFPAVSSRSEKRALYSLVSTAAAIELQRRAVREPSLIGKTVKVWLPADDDVDMYVKGHIRRGAGESARRLNDRQLAWIDELIEQGNIEQRFNKTFFTAGDSREPEQAGIWGAAAGSFFTLVVTLALSFPIGIAAAIYLEEFAPKNRWTDLIEVNINNLAAVPSIVFGLLGLAVFINFFDLPRSSPLVGGLVLTFMTLPTIIIAARAAIKSVPPSIREAALGIGASSMQTVFHHVLPLAMPGMLTGAIIGMARALGESAPLLMIGMVAFIVDIPHSVMDPATVLPVQVYLWADSPERGFVERTSAAIIVLLAFLITMNALAVYLRSRFERRW